MSDPRVLVVDDIADNRDIYTEYLRFRGYEVVTAVDGRMALDVAGTGAFDVIVMDLALPDIDGIEATRRLKKDARTRDIPIIILTGHIDPTHEQRALAAGCDLFLTKPFLPADLDDEIRQLLRDTSSL